jgi:hypothetical protein
MNGGSKDGGDSSEEEIEYSRMSCDFIRANTSNEGERRVESSGNSSSPIFLSSIQQKE